MQRIPIFVLVIVIPYLFVRSYAAGQPREPIEVTAEGRVSGTDPAAMERAKDLALRRAVEEAVSSFVSTQTKSSDYQANYDKALAKSGEYVTQFDVISKHTEGGMSYCTVRAKVSREEFEKDWAELIRTNDTLAYPRCMFVILEHNEADNPGRMTNVAQSVLERYFIEKGVQLMDRGGDLRKELQLAAETGDTTKLATLAAATKAEAVILGEAEAKHAAPPESPGQPAFNWTATFKVRAFRTDNGQLLMSNMYTTSSNSSNTNIGRDQALRICAQENVRTILKDLGEAWRAPKTEAAPAGRYLISFEDCRRADFQKFLDVLRGMEGVTSVRMHNLIGDVCEADVDYSADLSQLVGRIQKLNDADSTYILLSQTPLHANFKFKK